MTKYKIERDGFPPLKFTGERIGNADNRTHNSTRWTVVEIYRTRGGKFVGRVERITQWEGERDTSTAEAFADFGALIQWLKDGEDALGRVSQEAVVQAIEAHPELAACWAVEIE
jgi:hypothetical protein